MTAPVLTKHCHRHCHFKLAVSRQTMTQHELRGSTTKLSKIEFSATRAPSQCDGRRRLNDRQRCRQSSHVSYRLVTTCQHAANEQKITRSITDAPPQRLAGGQIPSVAATCRKSGSFARDKVHNIGCYHRGKGPEKEFFDRPSAASGSRQTHLIVAGFAATCGNSSRSQTAVWQRFAI